jgi:hypothetical protein
MPTLLAGQLSHIGHRLDRLAQARLVSQDAIEVLLVEVHHPVHADLLVLTQGTVQQDGSWAADLRNGRNQEETFEWKKWK